MERLGTAPRTQEDWAWNNPKAAAQDFLARHPEFELAVPLAVLNESGLSDPVSPVTYWPGAWLRRRAGA
ncbi:hypothetical protein GWK36_09965 [Caldichromatium japonicum]|uniref:Uncharacterized protein n=1 Tax=Caldichromatium japonicum TaxID=2699430 RepID=A0A6G7VDY0_9GAMM|nr:hypothetical protein [Caldichromatium japonicum]QIK38249.1 hypothetical protein GWK36_09965 [Caldichromatium japonicum]